MEEPFRLFTIYCSPADFPGKYIVRQWSMWKGEQFPRANLDPHCVADTLNEARASLPKGLVCLARNDEDVPCVVESWI